MPRVTKPLAPGPWHVRYEGGSVNTLRGKDGKAFGRVEGSLNAARMSLILGTHDELFLALNNALAFLETTPTDVDLYQRIIGDCYEALNNAAPGRKA